MTRFQILLLGAVSFAFPLAAQSDVLPMRFSNLPACPEPKATGDKPLLRLKEPSGLGVEIWCAKEAAGYNYQYRLLSSDGRTKSLDRCQLDAGLNSVGVEHTGPIAETPLDGGAILLRTPGRLVRFTQDNWDAFRGRHTVYDFQKQLLTAYETEGVEDGIGRRVRVLTSARGLTLPAAPIKDLALDRSFDPSRTGCVTAPIDQGMHIHEEQVAAFVEPGKAGKLTVAWPELSAIDKIEFDAARRQLKLKFAPSARKTIVSIAIPRTMLGLGKELSHVRLDGRFVDSDETTTATHKVIRFALDEPAREAMMVESGGFPFFMVSGIAIVGGILIGGVVALLFRRKLPAVPEDEIDPRDRKAVD